MYEHLLTETVAQITTITINRPTKLNALHAETIVELHEAFKMADRDLNTKVIIITGSGEKAFVAGADIREFSDFSIAEGKQLAAHGHRVLFDYVANLSTPVIAAINGFALGGGLELAMAAHIRVASTTAKLGLPEVSLGLIPGYGGTQRLPQLVGKGRALELMMTASMIDAEKALQWGLVNHIIAPETVVSFATTLAKKIAKNSTVAIRAVLTAVNAGYQDGVNGFDTEISEFGHCFGTEDFKEGTTAFLEKRKADFPGC